MKFIEALKLRSKLFFLFLLITLGILSVGIMGSIYVNSLKKNVDSLYFGSLVPVTELNNILHIYNNSLADTLYKASRLEVDDETLVFEISHDLNRINNIWKSYYNHYKTEDEMAYVNYVDSMIDTTNTYFYQLVDAAKKSQDFRKLSINTLEHKVENIHNVLIRLITYEVDVAKYERKKFLETYNTIMMQLGFILSFVIIAIVGVLFYVFSSIQKDHNKLKTIAHKLKIANKKLENASYTDTLTNLHNRRYFNFIYERELKRAKRNRGYITFMMIDIDYFKQYNDTYGHLEGDFALKSVAKVLRESLRRPSDYVFRLGGEEFGVLLSDTDENNSGRLARDICDAVRARKIKHENSKVNQYLTISIGVVCCIADDALDDEVLLSKADEMLYKAKENGRDRYVMTTEITRATIHATLVDTSDSKSAVTQETA